MRYYHVFLLSLLALLTACGNDEEFVINCEIRGLGQEGVEMFYINRSIQHAVFHPVDGKVSLRGVSSEPTLVEVVTNSGTPLFVCVASNGDDLSVKMDLDNPGQVKIEGNDASEEFSRFISANDSILRSGDIATVNRLIADEVRTHPDRISSAMLLATRFQARGYELEADSLINILKPQARPSNVMGAFSGMVSEQVSADARGNVKTMTINCALHQNRDSTLRYWPSSQSYTLIAFTGRSKGDSVRSALRNLTDSLPSRRFKAIELSLAGDSTSWRLSVRNDSANWWQGWLPGGASNPSIRSMVIPSYPFFIVSDSIGKQVYRGYSVRAAADSVRNRLRIFLKAPEKDTVEDTPEPQTLSTPKPLKPSRQAHNENAPRTKLKLAPTSNTRLKTK
ncbi:MAG: hypothetical protein NC411_02015 [Bacteroides sp.]|nr:hypothetical protein [Bacteroides sp.]